MIDKQTLKTLEEMLVVHGTVIALKEANPDIELNIPEGIKNVICTLEEYVKEPKNNNG